jgi:peptide/nickel transport system permease protein
VVATLDIGGAILSEASLSFLGMGDPRSISWGNILSTGLQDMVPAPWIAIFPGIAIFLAVWSVNMLGDALRDL